MNKKPADSASKNEANRKSFDRALDRFEHKLEELRILYEQHFVDILPFAPDKEHKEIKRFKRELLKAPFKNSAKRFRMRQLITRLNTLETYWMRVQKEREEGKYIKDIFRADIREAAIKEAEKMSGESGAAERGFQQLFGSYQDAMKKAGMKSDNVNYDAFRNSLIKQARMMKEKHGVKKLNYKIVVKGGKAVVKAVAGSSAPGKKNKSR